MDFYDILLAKKLSGGGGGGGSGGFTFAQIADRTAPIGDVNLTGMTIFQSDNLFMAFNGITSVVGENKFWGFEFSKCSGLQRANITITNKVGEGCNSLFVSCSNLKNAVLRFTDATVPTGMFLYCSNIEKVDISNDSTGGYIRTNWFNGCAKLNTLILRKSSVLQLENTGAFANSGFASAGSGGTLYVPQSLISSYQTASNWSTILGYANNQIKAIEGSIYETQYADGTPIGA